MDMKKILQAMDGVAARPVEGSNDMKKFLSVVTESASPHKVALPVQMVMNHYQSPKETTVKKESLFKKYFAEAEDQATAEQAAEQTIREQRIKQYARKIADRVLEGKESAREKWTKASNEREKKHIEREAEIAKLPKEKRSGAAIDALEKHMKSVDEHIVKVAGGYELKSKHSNKNLGKYPTKAGAEKRERQVQYFKHAGKSVEESWSDKIVAQRTGQPRTPYSVYIKGQKWKDFANDDHAEAVANKLKAKFTAAGRDPNVITIAPTDYDKK